MPDNKKSPAEPTPTRPPKPVREDAGVRDAQNTTDTVNPPKTKPKKDSS